MFIKSSTLVSAKFDKIRSDLVVMSIKSLTMSPGKFGAIYGDLVNIQPSIIITSFRYKQKFTTEHKKRRALTLGMGALR